MRCGHDQGLDTRWRARTLADLAASSWKAIALLDREERKLTRQAVATAMGIDRATLKGYLEDDLLPEWPWEGLQIPGKCRDLPDK